MRVETSNYVIHVVDSFFHKIISTVRPGILLVLFALLHQSLELLADVRDLEIAKVSAGEVEAKFDLQGGAQDQFRVRIAVSLNEGEIFEESGWRLSGDGVDAPIAPGTGYRLVWNAGVDLPPQIYEQALVKLRVGRLNTPPQIQPVSSLRIKIGELLQFPLQAAGPNLSEQQLTFSIVSAPQGAELNAKSGVFQWTPTLAQQGNYTMILAASDGLEESRVTFQVYAGWEDYRLDLNGLLGQAESIAMIEVSPGTFRMGSPSSEAQRRDDEGPFQATLSRGFWMSQHEITQGQWTALMGGNPSEHKSVGTRAPVEQVSQQDALAFCQAVTVMERNAGRLSAGEEYMLPTEAQWEYVCRAGSTTAFAFGA